MTYRMLRETGNHREYVAQTGEVWWNVHRSTRGAYSRWFARNNRRDAYIVAEDLNEMEAKLTEYEGQTVH